MEAVRREPSGKSRFKRKTHELALHRHKINIFQRAGWQFVQVERPNHNPKPNASAVLSKTDPTVRPKRSGTDE
jgi:hypothetical protein